MKYTKYPELKKNLKQLAKEIREWKNNRKMDARHKLGLQQWEVERQVEWRKRDFRHDHIAYCMLRGRKYEQIENFCKVAPDFDRIKATMDHYEQKIIRISA